VTPPDQIGLHAEAQGGGLAQDVGAFQNGVPIATAPNIGPGGVLNLLASAGDQQSGIQKIRIIGSESTCKWSGGGYTQVTHNGAKEWFAQVNTPSSGTVPEQSTVQTSVFVGNELGSADRLEMMFQVEATNFGGLVALSQPVAYQSVNQTGHNHSGSCPP